jgi:hypothetical protein
MKSLAVLSVLVALAVAHQSIMPTLAQEGATAAAIAEDKKSNWQFEVKVDPFTDQSRGLAITKTILESNIAMIVSCAGKNGDEMYMSFTALSYLGNDLYRDIIVRVDGQPAQTLTAQYDGSRAVIWVEERSNSTSSRGENYRKTKLFLDISTASKLAVQLYDPFDRPAVVGVIDVSGAKEAFAQVATACKSPMLDYLNK